MSAMLFALIFPRAKRASTYDISAERNVWLQPALRSFAIVCDYMETGLFAIVCDLRSAIVCDLRSSAIRDRLRSFAIIWKPALKKQRWIAGAEGGAMRWMRSNHPQATEVPFFVDQRFGKLELGTPLKNHYDQRCLCSKPSEQCEFSTLLLF